MVIALTTTGTSLLTNTNRGLKLGCRFDELVRITGHEIDRFMSECRDRPDRISAEVNSLEKIAADRVQSGRQPVDKVHLFLSDTPEMQLVSQKLEKWFRKRGYRVAHTTVESIGYRENRFQVKGLRSLVTELSNAIRDYQRRGNEVLLNATGGFKAEAAYAALTAQMFQVETFYLHESFKEIISLPPLPSDFSPYTWVRHADELERLYHGVPAAEASPLMDRLPAEARLLTEYDREMEEWTLNAVGLLIWEKCRTEQAIALDESDKPVTVKRGETTLWHKTRKCPVAGLNDIPDKDVRELLRRVLRFPFVRQIQLVDFHTPGKAYRETCLRYVNTQEGNATDAVRYRIQCGDGEQQINILVDSGKGGDLLFMLGTRAYR
jgi:putative CRISPR-associated protein (TIGR02619 family)